MTRRPTAASLKRVSAENLARLGAERLAEILLEVADTRADLKRRLRMELAAEQGAAHLLPEIDRRLSRLSTSRGAVGWRQRPAFVRDLDGVRSLIAGRLAALDLSAAQDRIVAFLDLAEPALRRVRDKEGAVDAVFARAAADAVELCARLGDAAGGASLAAALAAHPMAWSRWATGETFAAHAALAGATLAWLGPRSGAAWGPILRRLADAAQDVDAYRATFTPEALRAPTVAAQVAARLLRSGRLDEARTTLEAAVQPTLLRPGPQGPVKIDEDWESVWIDYLDATGQSEAAQAARWASFERTLSLERAKAYVQRLPDFEDVEAEDRIFALAAVHGDAERALGFLLDWPALPQAAALVTARGDELSLNPEQAEGWARRLRRRFPRAAERLLRGAAAQAFRRREYAASTRLTEEADAIPS